MKRLSEKAGEIFKYLISKLEDDYVKIKNNDSFMPVSVERIGTVRQQVTTMSLVLLL